MKPFCYHGELIGEDRFPRQDRIPICRLSLLGLGGGGGGLGLSGSASDAYTGPQSGGTITVNNGSNGPLSTNNLLIIAGAILGGLLILLLIFRK